MEKMESQYSFNASKAQYVRQFKEWKWRKNLKSDEWKVIGEHIRRRKDEQKDSEVLLCGIPLSSERVKKETSRHCYSTMEALEQQYQNAPPKLPDEITVQTPKAMLRSHPSPANSNSERIMHFAVQYSSVLLGNEEGFSPCGAANLDDDSLGSYVPSGSPRMTHSPCTSKGIIDYRLVKNGYLDVNVISYLVERYVEHFHSYFPLVPEKYFDPDLLDLFASTEEYLLTAVLTIASKKFGGAPQLHKHCSVYMSELVSEIAAGVDCEIGAIEALLLLSEWEPWGLHSQINELGRGEEDRAAWMHVGLASCLSAFEELYLPDGASLNNDGAFDEQFMLNIRKRVARASCHIFDQVLSIRIGCKLSTNGLFSFSGSIHEDFKSLSPEKDDYAQIFQANFEFSQLCGEVHGILSPDMRSSKQMILEGHYRKYIDNFLESIFRWDRVWENLNYPVHLKATLRLSYEYLRLYINAFGFQAAITQAYTLMPTNNTGISQTEYLRSFFSNIDSMDDARFIHGALDAAKSYLSILTTEVNPEKHLRFMPLRYYMFGLYAALFLHKVRLSLDPRHSAYDFLLPFSLFHKAHSFGIIREEDERQKVFQTTYWFRRASTGPLDIGSRYAQRLEMMWGRDLR
ncbi:hypothetical protein Egran_00220, partial [Elaphomyces granulatus]